VMTIASNHFVRSLRLKQRHRR